MAATGTCTYLAAKELNLWFSGTAYSFPGTFFLAVDTGTAGAAGLQFEVSSGNGYAELSVVASTTLFPNITATNVMVNGASGTLSFATATGAWTGNSGANTTSKGLVIKDSGTIGSGNSLFFGSNTTPETVVNNDILQYTPGNFSVTFN